jgi:hypothetical protein
MVNTMISIPGYVHLYRSLLRFYDMPENEVREMLYLLNTANLDCYEYYHPDRSVIQSGPVAFCEWLETICFASIPARARWGVVCCKAAAALNAPSRSGSSPVYSLVFRFKVSAQSRTCSSKTALTSFCVI